MPSSFGQVIPVTGLTLGFAGTVSRLGERVITARQVLPSTPSNIAFGAPAVIVSDSLGGTFQSVVDFLTAPAVTVQAATVNAVATITVASAAGIVEGMVASGSGIGSNAVVTAIAGLVVTLSAASTSTSSGTVAVTFAIPSGNAKSLRGAFAGIAVREVKTMLTYPSGTTPGVQQVGYYAPGEMAEVLERGSITVPIAYGTPAANAQVYLRVVANGALSGTAVGDLEAAADTAASTTMGTTLGSAVVAVASPSGIVVGQIASGAGIPPNAAVVSISSSNITLSQPATATVASGVAVTFSNTIPLPGALFRTGYLDANNLAEITITQRNAA